MRMPDTRKPSSAGALAPCVLAVAAALLLAGGCTPATDRAPAEAGAGPRPPVDAAPSAAGGGGVPAADVVVSTNEPFWSARVEGDAVLLTGPEGERRFAVVGNRVDAGVRRVSARDAGGGVELEVRDGPCEDDMSGARFPYAGTLRIDATGPFRGCARPADQSPPRPPAE